MPPKAKQKSEALGAQNDPLKAWLHACPIRLDDAQRGRDPNAAEWGCGMTDRETVAVKDAEGNLRWFPVADAEHWPPTTLDACDLYRIGGRWIMRPGAIGSHLTETGRRCGQVWTFHFSAKDLQDAA